MSWKDVLVVTNSAGHGAACVRAAAELARQHGAALNVCIPAVIPSFSGWGDLPVSAGAVEEALAGVKEQAARLSREFAKVVGETVAHVRQHQIETGEAGLRSTVADYAQIADVVVVLQPSRHHKAQDSAAILDGVLFGSGRPVLMLPESTIAPAFGSRILVGWKPGREAARALHDALPMLQRAEAVRLFMGSEESIGSAEYATRLARLTDHLVHHGVKLAAGDQQPFPRGASILEAAKTWGADMIVMGAYGHSRLQEWVFGGATQTAVMDSWLPVLFSH